MTEQSTKKQPLVLDLSPTEARERAESILDQSDKSTIPLMPRELSINIKYTDPNGHLHSDTVTSRIMTGQDKTLCDLTAMTLMGNQRIDNLPTVLQMRYLALARLEVQLRPCPEWLSTWASEDDVLLMRLFDHLEAHHLRYFRRDVGTGTPSKIVTWLSIDSDAIAVEDSTGDH